MLPFIFLGFEIDATVGADSLSQDYICALQLVI